VYIFILSNQPDQWLEEGLDGYGERPQIPPHASPLPISSQAAFEVVQRGTPLLGLEETCLLSDQ
jgi:hypothetical protein